MFAWIAYADARLWTWEVVTGFDGVLDAKTLHARFADEFPKVAEACWNGECAAGPVFREMVSFNSADGRRHRYLVMRAETDVAEFRRRCDRVLPRMAMLYGCADKLMCEEECTADGTGIKCVADTAGFKCAGENETGNCRFAFLAGGALYILVFFEGRLCHWTCEPDCDATAAGERLERFDEFLRRDDLFSRAETWSKWLVCVDGAGERERREWCRRAARDPFWKAVDLDECAGLKPRAKRKIALLALAGMALFFAGVATFFDKGIAYTRPAPDLSPVPESVFGTPYETEPVEKFYEEKPHERSVRTSERSARQEEAANDAAVQCTALGMKLYGVVEGRLVQASVDGGERVWLRVGDSVGAYVLAAIGKDKISLVCGDTRMEVFNGQ